MKTKDRKEIFENIYTNSIWGFKETKCGGGSLKSNTVEILEFLEKVCDDRKIKKILDIGCGDLNWISQAEFFNPNRYYGIDISSTVIKESKKKYPDSNLKVHDIVTSFPKNFCKSVDLIILRDIIFHTKIEDVKKIIRNIKGKFKYIAVTDGRNELNTDDMDLGHWCPRNLNRDPFNFPRSYTTVQEEQFNRDFSLWSHDEIYD